MAWTRKDETSSGPRYRVFWYSPDGRQHSRTFLKLEDARRFERTVEVRKDEGNYVDPNLGKITVFELADRFLELRGPHLAKASEDLYQRELRLHVLPHPGKRRISTVSIADVRDFEKALRAAGVGGATVAMVHRIGHAMFAFAMQEDRIGRNPFRPAPRGAPPFYRT